MGGNLAWTLRLSDGTEYRMDRWTNPMPIAIQDPAFLAEDPKAISEALDAWIAMNADWEANRESGDFEHPMTPVYAPYPFGLRPSEYGAVVTCFKTRQILSLQDYTHFGQIMPLRLLFGPGAESATPAEVKQFEKLRLDGRISSYRFVVRSNATALAFEAQGHAILRKDIRPGEAWWEITIEGDADYAALEALCAAQRGWGSGGPDLVGGEATVDLSPFTLTDFPVSAAGYRAMLTRILELGFVLSDDERKDWEARIAEMEEEEE